MYVICVENLNLWHTRNRNGEAVCTVTDGLDLFSIH